MISQESLLVKIVKLAGNILRDLQLPKHVGRPYAYQPVVIICCLLVMAAKRLSVRALYAFLTSNDGQNVYAAIPFPQRHIPNRRTFDRRFKQSLYSLELAMVLISLFFVKQFHLGIARLALDNRMFAAFGNIWHRKDQIKNHIPKGLRNIDKTAGWGFSHYRRWVFGHSLEVFVTTGKLVLPILAFAHSLTIRGNTAVKHVVSLLPKARKGIVAADSEYEDTELATLLTLTGRYLHVARKRYPKTRPKSKTYQKRKKTVEPFYERFLLAFAARGKLDRKGPQAWPYLVACCLLYQLMVLHNLLTHVANPLEVTHLIRML